MATAKDQKNKVDRVSGNGILFYGHEWFEVQVVRIMRVLSPFYKGLYEEKDDMYH